MYKDRTRQREYDRLYKHNQYITHREAYVRRAREWRLTHPGIYNAVQARRNREKRTEFRKLHPPQCIECGLSIENARKRQELHDACKYTHTRAYMSVWRKLHRESEARQNRNWHRKTHYGVTPEQVALKLQEQEGKCVICKKILDPNGGRGTREYVDHDHVTKKFRGLLCSTCNAGLGDFKDNPELLRTAANYLDRVRNS